MDASDPVFDAVCFHAHQCIEKYLKALLQEHGIVFPRGHDLSILAALASDIASELQSKGEDLALLTTYAVAPRYPGTTTIRTDAEGALGAMHHLRDIPRAVLLH
jgi:HEPN domain-containing protein